MMALIDDLENWRNEWKRRIMAYDVWSADERAKGRVRVYTTKDKSDWGDGPWQDEPDKIQWIDKKTGLPCLIVRNHNGAWCGYVGVSEGHPYFGKDYDSVDVDVHGGLTYADHCMEGEPEEESVCHIPEPGEPDHVWWFGFDCHHFMDYGPAFEARMREHGIDHDPDGLSTYKTVVYVRDEVINLAEQLAIAR